MARKEISRNLKDDKEKTQQEKVELNKAKHGAHHDLSGKRGTKVGGRNMMKKGK